MNHKLGFVTRNSKSFLRLEIISTRRLGTDADALETINTKKYPQVKQEFTDEGFPILKLFPRGRNIFEERRRQVREVRERRPKLTSREETMPEDIDWPSAWPTQKTFVPSSVPLPLRQSYEQRGVSRGKYVNTELLKIANFLHLTPVAIERHCQALKKFCTPWPDGLETEEKIREHFPVTKVTRDYVHASPNIRDPRARIVDLEVNIKDLNLDRNAEIKLIKLAQHRYDEKTGIIKITASACPVRIQNEDYADYLMTALYYESIKREKWEDEKDKE